MSEIELYWNQISTKVYGQPVPWTALHPMHQHQIIGSVNTILEVLNQVLNQVKSARPDPTQGS